MTRIAINLASSRFSVKTDMVNADRLGPRLAAVPMIVFGSPDVQVNTYFVDHVIRQFVLVEGEPVDELEGGTSISVEMLHVHSDVTQEDNNLAAKVALAAIWGTLDADEISNPNVLVLQNGSASYGWAEGMHPWAGFGPHVVEVLDDFLGGHTDRATARASLVANLTDD